MLTYLAATLPDDSPPPARLLALQCALRVDDTLHVRLPRGVLRSLRLDTSKPWYDLEQAHWLHTLPASTPREIAARLLDPALLGQAPARPDRRRAADWALRAGRPSKTAEASRLHQLASIYFAAHTDALGSGLAEPDRMARACGLQPEELPPLLTQLTSAGVLGSWHGCPYTQDLHWTLKRSPGPHAK
ncbi:MULTISPECIES: hypothetical protein [unclassified Streptomyces]|uniref:hypothetical protein n=1 Tax=unclassified Streptomyces TaxID=2593676 RepID=UPI0035DF1466